MGDLFNDVGEFQPDIAASMSDAQLRLAIAQLEVDHEVATNEYRAAKAASVTGRAPADGVRATSYRLDALRTWLRQCGEAAGIRSTKPAGHVEEG